MRVLVTGGGGPGSEMLWKLWKDKHSIYFADQDISRIYPGIPRNQRAEVPPGIDPLFISKVIAVTKDLTIDLIISQVDEELVALKENEKALAPAIVIAPPLTFIKMFLDKFNAGQSLASNEIYEPDTQLLTEKSKLDSCPLLVKPRIGRGSRDLFIAKSDREFEKLKEYLLTRNEDFIVQELKLGIEYSVQMLANSKGELKAIIPVKINAKRGSTTSGKVENNRPVIDTCLKFHSKYSPSGTYNIQLILSAIDGIAFIFEVNPRVSTTMCLGLFGGADPIESYFDIQSKGPFKTVEDGLELQRFWVNSIYPKVSI